MIVKYIYPTPYGQASIELTSTGRWNIVLAGEQLGSYHSPESALSDFEGGHTFSHSRCPDTAELGLPDSLLDWARVSR